MSIKKVPFGLNEKLFHFSFLSACQDLSLLGSVNHALDFTAICSGTTQKVIAIKIELPSVLQNVFC